MNHDHDMNKPDVERESDLVPDDLRVLRDWLGAQHYPGRAWQPPHHRRWRLAVAAAALAACLALIASPWFTATQTSVTVAPNRSSVSYAPIQTVTRMTAWSMPDLTNDTTMRDITQPATSTLNLDFREFDRTQGDLTFSFNFGSINFTQLH